MLTFLANEMDMETPPYEDHEFVAPAVIDLNTPPRSPKRKKREAPISPKRVTSPVPSSSQRSSQKRRGGVGPRSEILPLDTLVKEGLVEMGDVLTFQSKSAVVLRDGWLEFGRDTITLEAFVAKTANHKKCALHGSEKAEVLSFGQLAYSMIHVNDDESRTLLSLGEMHMARATTLKTEPSPETTKVLRPASPLSDSAPLSLVADDGDDYIGDMHELTTQLPPGTPLSTLAAIETRDAMNEEREKKSNEENEEDESIMLPEREEGNDNYFNVDDDDNDNNDDNDEDDLLDMVVANEAWRSGSTRAKRNRAASQAPVPIVSASARRVSSSQPIVIVLDESSSPESTPVTRKSFSSNMNKRARIKAADEGTMLPPPPSPKTGVAVVAVTQEIEEERMHLELNKRFLEGKKPAPMGPPPRVASLSQAPTVPVSLVSDPVILCSGLDSQKIAAVLAATSSLGGGSFAPEWSSNVTHVVIRERSNGQCRRTIKYLLGVLSGVYVVSPEWISKSRAAAAWLEETPFLVCDDHFKRGDNVVAASLLRYRRGLPPLFDGFQIHLFGDFNSASASKSDLELLLQAGGAQILSDLPIDTNADRVVILSPSNITIAESNFVFAQTGRDPIFFTWLVDCISDLSILPVRNCSEYKCTFNEDVAVPMHLFQTQNSPAL